MQAKKVKTSAQTTAKPARTPKTAVKSSKQSSKETKVPRGGTPKGRQILGFELTAALQAASAGSEVDGELLFVGAAGVRNLRKLFPELPQWLIDRMARRRGEAILMPAGEKPQWVVTSSHSHEKRDQLRTAAIDARLEGGAYGAARDALGMAMAVVADQRLGRVGVRFLEASADEQLGGMVGLEIGAYRFRQSRVGRTATVARPSILVEGVSSAQLAEASSLGTSVNLARHLVNLPPCDLTPASFADAAVACFADSATATVEVIEGEELERLGFGLLAAVGRAAEVGPRLVRIRYRPLGKGGRARPVAVVGKGITFDSGGLDIKDASNMRLMKKDMGGAGSVLGLALWTDLVKLPRACDFYLALAENAVSEQAFRPGDIITAKSGHTIEIDNTDAEGRLVLADAIDAAVRRDDENEVPVALIDIATLTGAMRVAVGTRIAGFFANDDQLAQAIERAASERGEAVWRLPLFQDYFSQLKSNVADFANSGGGRFGGAISAALFLQRFVGQVPWLHFDLYAWTDGPFGGCVEAGGTGQGVQALSHFLATADFGDEA